MPMWICYYLMHYTTIIVLWLYSALIYISAWASALLVLTKIGNVRSLQKWDEQTKVSHALFVLAYESNCRLF